MNDFALLLESFRPLLIFVGVYAVVRFAIEGAAHAHLIEELTAKRLAFIVNLFGMVFGVLFFFNQLSRMGHTRI
ncbi:MAG: hypothetical protein HRF49_02775 [bacterium]|jgi:prolipoprotein diacylglyceryltransferase